jgi:hypothetical protein
MAATPIEILIVDDNPGDVLLTKEALRDAKILNMCMSHRMALWRWHF